MGSGIDKFIFVLKKILGPLAGGEWISFIRRVLQHFGWERIVVWVKLLALEKEMNRFILRTELIRPLMKKKAHAGQYSLFSFS